LNGTKGGGGGRGRRGNHKNFTKYRFTVVECGAGERNVVKCWKMIHGRQIKIILLKERMNSSKTR
jgi:hypothetical protein